MAKIIQLTPEIIEELRQDFEQSIDKLKIADGKFSFTKNFGDLNRHATLWFTDIAWQKMQTLIREFDKEVAWHGIAFRGDDPEKDEYTVEDILVYPQEVTGTTVTTDQEKYQMWLMEQEDDVFNNIRMQGHSHVNMGTSPSSVDNSLYERILDLLDDDMFYIFLIWNKRGEKYIRIYDMRENVLFETKDVSVKVQGGDGLGHFLDDAKSKVVTRSYMPQTMGGYSVYGLPSQGTAAAPAAASTPAKSQPIRVSEADVKKKEKNKKQKGGGFLNPRPYNCLYDDMDDPYGPFGYNDSFWR